MISSDTVREIRVCVFRMTLTATTGTLTLWAAAWQSQIQPLWKPAAPPAAFVRATRYTGTHMHVHTHIWLIGHPATQDDSVQDNDVGADLCTVCVCLVAQWKHDESVQLRRFRSGGGEGPYSILIGLWHPEGGAARQSVSLWGHCFSTQEPLWPVSYSVYAWMCVLQQQCHMQNQSKNVYVCAPVSQVR